MAYLAFMDEPIVTGLDAAVGEFLSMFSAGADRVGCNFLWYAFEHSYPAPVSLVEFEDAVSRTRQTSRVYGKLFIDGLDSSKARQMYLGVFA